MRERLIVLTSLVLLANGVAHGAEKITAGWIEPVQITPGGLVLDAKLDTGATTSSLNCQCSEPQQRGGKDWVRFSVQGKDGKMVDLEREVVRKAKIKRHFGDKQERLVVKLGLCLGQVYKEVEVTLVDRTGFSYPLLIGRNFLTGNILVDSGVERTTSPSCKVPAPQ